MKFIYVVILSFGLWGAVTVQAATDPESKVPANSPLGFKTQTTSTSLDQYDREEANKAVKEPAEKSAPSPENLSKNSSEKIPPYSERDIRESLVSLSERIGKIRDETITDTNQRDYKLKAELARLDERWQRLNDKVIHNLHEGENLTVNDRKQLTAQLIQLKKDVGRVQDAYTPGQ